MFFLFLFPVFIPLRLFPGSFEDVVVTVADSVPGEGSNLACGISSPSCSNGFWLFPSPLIAWVSKGGKESWLVRSWKVGFGEHKRLKKQGQVMGFLFFCKSVQESSGIWVNVFCLGWGEVVVVSLVFSLHLFYWRFPRSGQMKSCAEVWGTWKEIP